MNEEFRAKFADAIASVLRSKWDDDNAYEIGCILLNRSDPLIEELKKHIEKESGPID